MRALDLFAGGGGACLGMQWAGFEVVGVDHEPHYNYPGHFIQGDALAPPVNLSDFDLIWASPPCQKFSMGTHSRGATARDKHVNLIPQTRALLSEHQFTVIENVPQAPIRDDLILVGEMFGLTRLWRKRHFELSFFCLSPPMPKQSPGTYYTIAGTLGCNGHFYRRKKEGKPGTLTLNEGKLTMGIPLCFEINRKEIAQAVPPVYSQYIAEQVKRLL